MTDFKLKIKSKKLDSGKFQVNFATDGFSDNYYGYVLADSQTPVREVVEKIQRHLEAMQTSDRYFQPNLFSLGRREVNSGRVMIFKKAA
jgi:hypothetical protein